MQQKWIACGFFIPMCRDKNLSDGKAHLPEAWDWFQGRRLEIGEAGGVMGLHQCFSVGKLRAVLRAACRVFAQERIFLSVAGLVEYVEGDGARAEAK